MFVPTESYLCFRKDRQAGKGGGVFLMIKKSLCISARQVFLCEQYDSLELICVDVNDQTDSLPLRIVVAYRPPNYSSSENALHSLADDCAHLCVMGDFNLPNFDWDLFAYPSNYLYLTAAEFICENGLTQVVSEPTRDEHILDIILCSDILCCDDVCILPPVGNGDHNVVFIEISVSLEAPISQPSVTLRPNFSKANWSELNNFLALINWHAEFADCKTASDYLDKFTLIVNDGIHKNVPLVRVGFNRLKHPYYTKHVRKLLAVKKQRWRLYRQFRTDKLLASYKRASKSCSKAINEYWAETENNLISRGNTGAFYKYVNKKLNCSNGIAPLKCDNGSLVFDDAEKATLLNKYFSSVFTHDNGVINPTRLPNKSVPNISSLYVSPVYGTTPLDSLITLNLIKLLLRA